jgi:hypothetical protein
MIGIAVASRTNANTARTSVQLTTPSGVPVNLTDASSTRYTESWLMTSAAASIQPRVRNRPTTRSRNRTADSPHVAVAARRSADRRTTHAARAAAAPIRRANDSLRSARASTVNVARNTATPASAAGSPSPLVCPVAARSPREMAGSSSLNDMLTANVAIADRATSGTVNPHDA